ncbi:MAG: histidine phosphatase family protein [Mucilaginibacter sp.]
MKRIKVYLERCVMVFIFLFLIVGVCSTAKAQGDNLRIVFVRHGEKDATGDNLNCRGLNRAMQLPGVIVSKFGTPAKIYAPSINSKKSTGHARMFQTATPLAVKYSLKINTQYDVEDYEALAQNLKVQSGTIVIVWEHKAMDNILKALGVKMHSMKWGDNDFDSIWVVTFKNGKARLATDTEGLHPAGNCAF